MRNYYLVIDVEGAGLTNCAFVYDIGGVVVDKKGNIYETFSFIVSDIFFFEKELMSSAYYANKVPEYYKKIANKEIIPMSFHNIRNYILDIIDRYNIKEVFAYNASYDNNALNNTQRWLTKSKFRWFFPYNIKISCIWNMACQVLCTQKSYREFCEENNFITPNNRVKTSAEVVYSYIMKEKIIEEHTGLADAIIESDILSHCFRQKKKMSRNINSFCWKIPNNQ